MLKTILLAVALGQVPAATEALAEVNAARARRGLPAFIRDEGLTAGAMQCAKIRAAGRVKGHLGWNGCPIQYSDFACMPLGYPRPRATGAGALAPSWGWVTCATYDRYTYGGAAYVTGRDGLRYMSLFVR